MFKKRHRKRRKVKTYLFDADPYCKHKIIALWSGVKCTKCGGWYCL